MRVETGNRGSLTLQGIMAEKQRDMAETVFERNQRRETEINDALKQEYARREAAIANMYRLRRLRLARDAQLDRPPHEQ